MKIVVFVAFLELNRFICILVFNIFDISFAERQKSLPMERMLYFL